MLSRFLRLRRDARTGNVLVRRTVIIGHPCSYCGKRRQSRGRVILNLFQYGTEFPNGRLEWHKGYFCSTRCHDAYNKSTT